MLGFLWDCLTLTSLSTGYSVTEKGLHPATQTTPSRLLERSSQLEQTGNTRSGEGVGHAALSFKEGKRKHQGEKGKPRKQLLGAALIKTRGMGLRLTRWGTGRGLDSSIPGSLLFRACGSSPHSSP